MTRILIIDDDAEIRGMIARTLEQDDMEALQAENTRDALAALSVKAIDAVLLDLLLGSENGWETLRRLRELSAVPVVLISGACVDEEMRFDAEKLGAQDVLEKPFDAEELRACLSKVIVEREGK